MSKGAVRYKATPLAVRAPESPPVRLYRRLPSSRLATALTTIMVVFLPAVLITPLLMADAAEAQLSVSPTTPTAGARIVVSGTRFPTDLRGTLTLDRTTTVGKFATNADGEFSVRVTLSRTLSFGAHTLEAHRRTGQAGGSSPLAQTMITIADAQATATPSPAATAPPTTAPTAIPTAAGSPPATADPTPTPAQTAASSQPPAIEPPPSTATAPPTPASSRYVATTGHDANPGTLAQPWRTPARAAQDAPAGSTVYLRAGTYAGFDVTRSGLTFRSYPGEIATVSDPGREDVIEFSGVTAGALHDLVVQGSTAQYGSGVKIKESAGITVSGSTIRDNRTWGIVIVRSSDVRIEGNRITGNANGVEERYGDDILISGNEIFGNTAMVDAGRGKQGINFYKSTGTVTVIGNRLWDNGTHFEVYGASNLTISGNVTWNGQVMETGTDGLPCDGNRFIRNVGFRGVGFDGRANGMILRCASNMLVAHNTLHGFDQFALDLVDGTAGVPYGGSIENLRIVNNILTGGRAYSIDSALPASVSIDYNLLYHVGSTSIYGNHLAYVAGIGNLDSLEAFVAATGFDVHGRFGDPRFVDRAAGDFRLTNGSPAVDAGISVLGGGHLGAAPDLGWAELR
ncbi:MAG TPA: right-handed parallel beta-helix repeat-containing protein [Candidatus Limnocylindria bacterium]